MKNSFAKMPRRIKTNSNEARNDFGSVMNAVSKPAQKTTRYMYFTIMSSWAQPLELFSRGVVEMERILSVDSIEFLKYSYIYNIFHYVSDDLFCIIEFPPTLRENVFAGIGLTGRETNYNVFTVIKVYARLWLIGPKKLP